MWKVEEKQAHLVCQLRGELQPEGTYSFVPQAPLTCFDWCQKSPNLIATSSIDSVCQIWDLNKQQVASKLIAHDQQVNGISFTNVDNTFVTCSQDGQVRLFDTRCLKYSHIVFESKRPVLQTYWNKNDEKQIVVVTRDSTDVIIVDLNMPCTPQISLEHNA